MAFGYRGDPTWLIVHPVLGMGDGKTYGCACVPGPLGRELTILFSSPGDEPDQPPWEHVSVSIAKKIPTWVEMCWVKALFWDDEDAVMQLHPPKSTYVNNHPNCLHLWRPVDVPIPLPDRGLV
jgi:hypothetical protein